MKRIQLKHYAGQTISTTAGKQSLQSPLTKAQSSPLKAMPPESIITDTLFPADTVYALLG